ncbi:hypothetical protein [Halobellus sp. Atlit-38R]|uniref:hypothetical protein n=1 Tax=Halobellus sp. Atlit-38R TaxID=2282131 RepID=UPI001F1BCE35|nr:hypothetical protein [Halobellus sp. Atlit-38R]
MSEGSYNVGDTVPEDLLQAAEAPSIELEFAVAIEIIEGYGGTQHVYPLEIVEDPEDLVTPRNAADAPIDVEPGDDTNLYTVPRDLL